MTRTSRVESRIDSCQKRLEWYRAHNVYGMVNGQPGWVYEAEIEFFEDQMEDLQQELLHAEVDDALDQLDYEMGEYEQTKIVDKLRRQIPVVLMWIPAVIGLVYGAREYALNVVAVLVLLLIARDAWSKIGVLKRN